MSDDDTTNQLDNGEPESTEQPTAKVDLRKLLDTLLAPLLAQAQRNAEALEKLTSARAQAEMTAPMLVLQHCYQNGTDYFARVAP